MYDKITALINNKNKFILTSHVNPDGDSIGSVVALCKYIRMHGKDARIIYCSPTPDNYKFLDNKGLIEEYNSDIHNDTIKNTEVIFILDTNEFARLKDMSEPVRNANAIKVCIDHHLGFDKKQFDYYISDIESPATGEILFKLFKQNNTRIINKELAVPLYTAIMTDTGSFRYPRTDSETHLIAAELIKLGADPVKIYEEVYDKSSIGIIRLLTRFLNKLTFLEENRIVYAILRQNDFKETGTTIMDTDGFSKHMLTVNTVQLAIIFTESKRGVKISFRSKNDIPVNKLAADFGGGGHLNASGTFIESPNIDELVTEVLNRSKNYIN